MKDQFEIMQQRRGKMPKPSYAMEGKRGRKEENRRRREARNAKYGRS